MNYKEKKAKIEYLLYLIERERLKNTSEIAKKFGCSRRTIERMINLLREDGYDIKYSRITCKYYIKK